MCRVGFVVRSLLIDGRMSDVCAPFSLNSKWYPKLPRGILSLATRVNRHDHDNILLFTPSKSRPPIVITMRFCAYLFILSALETMFSFTPPSVRRRSFSSLNAVSKKDKYTVTLLPGDGIGPEITTATKAVMTALCEKCNFEIEFKEALIGGAAIDAVQDPFPQESLDQCLASDSVLLACIGGYKWDNNPRELRPETGLLKMRKEMGLFANLRPAKVLPQLVDASSLKREVIEDVDVMVVRELTGDVYFGTPKGIDTVNGKSVDYLF